MTPEEIRDAIKQVQVQAMSLHRHNLKIAASTATSTRTDTSLLVERFEWWGAVLMGSLISKMIGSAYMQWASADWSVQDA